jgi:hypothetical protein
LFALSANCWYSVGCTTPFDAHDASITAAAIAETLALIWSFIVNSTGFDAWRSSVCRCAGGSKRSCMLPEPTTSWIIDCELAEPLETGDADATNIVAAVETGGNIHAAWVQGASVWTNRYTRGSGWAGAVQTAPGGDQPSITVSATGRAYLAYAVSGLTRRIWARQFN